MKQIILTDGVNEFTFNDNADGTILRKFEGFEYPDTRLVMEDIPVRDGSLYIGSRFGRRRLSWEGDIVDEDKFLKRRSLLQALSVGELKTLKFITYDDLELQAEIEIIKLLMPYTHQIHSYMVEAVSPDFRFFSQVLKSLDTGITEIGGGMAISAPIPAPIGGTSTTPLNAENEGTIYTHPIFTIRGPGTDFKVKNITNGENFELDLTLLTSEFVDVNTLNRTILKGNQNVFGSFSGDWIRLEVGDNNFTFSVQSGDTNNTKLFIEYRNAYLGV